MIRRSISQNIFIDFGPTIQRFLESVSAAPKYTPAHLLSTTDTYAHAVPATLILELLRLC
jgi:hypothetical protein